MTQQPATTLQARLTLNVVRGAGELNLSPKDLLALAELLLDSGGRRRRSCCTAG